MCGKYLGLTKKTVSLQARKKLDYRTVKIKHHE